MKTKLIPILLVLPLCLALFAGCQSSALRSYSQDAAEASPSPDSGDAAGTTLDYADCYASYDPDEVMLTINGIDVTWGELFYMYYSEKSYLEQYLGTITDWSAASSFDATKTNAEFIKDEVLETVKQYCVIESKAKELNVVLTDEDKQTLKTNWETSVTQYGNGDEAAFVDYLKTYYLTKDLYDRLSGTQMLYSRLSENLFGTNGDKLGEKEVLEKAADMGYIRVKNLLISTQDDTGAALPDDQAAEKKKTADGLLTELRTITDTAALEKRFDEMIAEYGEDSGTSYYPDGYTFVSGGGTMDTTFDTTASALKDYEISEVTKTDYGYHIILRLPLSAKATVELSSTDNSPETLAYFVAQDMFGSELTNWAAESKVTTTKTYDSLDLAEVFSKAKAA